MMSGALFLLSGLLCWLKGSLSSVASPWVGTGSSLLPPDFCPTLNCVTFRDSRALFSCCGRLALLWCTPVAWMVLYVSGMPGLAACSLTTGATLLRSWTLPSASKHCGLAALESGFSVREHRSFVDGRDSLRDMRPNTWLHPVIKACQAVHLCMQSES